MEGHSSNNSKQQQAVATQTVSLEAAERVITTVPATVVAIVAPAIAIVVVGFVEFSSSVGSNGNSCDKTWQ